MTTKSLAFELAGIVTLIAVGCRPAQDQVGIRAVPAGGETVSAIDAAPAAADVTVRRVAADQYNYFYASSISPDGRYMSMVDYSSNDLAVREIESGKTYPLTNADRVDGERRAFPGEAQVSVFSRDGRRVVVAWYTGREAKLVTLDFAVDDDGVPRPSKPKVLFDNPEYSADYPFDWSPDGSQVLAKVYVAGKTNQLALISTTDGTYRALKSFDWREPGRAAFSPDGKYVAYDFPPESDSPVRSVFVVSVDGSRETRIAEGTLLGWQPDGSILLTIWERNTPSIQRVPISEGRAVGRPELVLADAWGVEPLGFAGTRFFYGVTINPRRLNLATADFAASRLTSAPVATEVAPRSFDWSPDGKFLAYNTNAASGSLIGLMSADGNVIRTIHLDLGRTRVMQWDPDGGSIILYTNDAKNRHGFFRIDLASGSYSPILMTDGTEFATNRGHFALSPDGRTLYFTRSDPRVQGSRRELIEYDLASGTARHIADVSARSIWSPIAISPDGSRLAVVYPGSREGEGVVGTVSVKGGDFTPLDTIPAGVFVRMMGGWTADNWIYWTTIRPGAEDESGYRLRVASAAGDSVREIELPDGLNALVRVHRDGRRIAFEAGAPHGEVWVMEGLDRSATITTGGASR